jgi:DNA polymerase-3 subunit gamma/tau
VAALFHDPTLLTDLPDAEVQETMRQSGLRSADDLQRLFRLAQVSAEEIRRSMLPIVVLEMTLVKMATLPDAAPVDELIARLEAMERRLSGSGGEPAGRSSDERGGRPDPGPRSGPTIAKSGGPTATAAPALAVNAPAAPLRAGTTAPPVSAPQPRPPVAAAARSVGGATGWAGFIAAAQSKITLKVYLNGSRPLEESDEILHIGVENELALRALKDPDSFAILQELASRSYGGARRVQVSIAKAPVEEMAIRMAADDARRREVSERAERSVSVRAAIDILGGEVTDVQPRSRGGKP